MDGGFALVDALVQVVCENLDQKEQMHIFEILGPGKVTFKAVGEAGLSFEIAAQDTGRNAPGY